MNDFDFLLTLCCLVFASDRWDYLDLGLESRVNEKVLRCMTVEGITKGEEEEDGRVF